MASMVVGRLGAGILGVVALDLDADLDLGHVGLGGHGALTDHGDSARQSCGGCGRLSLSRGAVPRPQGEDAQGGDGQQHDECAGNKL
ncbi:MAG: hypothetical protein V9H69_02565 [Anaerolineae bacterium]